MKRLVLIFAVLTVTPAFADDFVIVPQVWANDATVQNAVENVAQKEDGKDVRDHYNTQAYTMNNDVGRQISSGIMTRDTLLNYVIYLVQFLSQVGLFVGALMIIKAGYKYGTAVFTGGKTPSMDDVKYAIYGVIVITFSYAIIRILSRAFLV